MKNVLFILSALATLALPAATAAQSAANFECRNARSGDNNLTVLDTWDDSGVGYVDTTTEFDPTGVRVFGAQATMLIREYHSNATLRTETLVAIVTGSYDDVVRAGRAIHPSSPSCTLNGCYFSKTGSSDWIGDLEIRPIDLTTVRVDCHRF